MGEAGIGTIFPKTHNNEDFPESMRLTCTAASAKACFFFSEAWEPETSVDDSAEVLTLLAVPLSEQPVGHECLVLLVETRGEKTSWDLCKSPETWFLN